jgi:nicotinate-nucleotide adenylyltransferase
MMPKEKGFMREKKIGFFGGTFDPIHFGHLNLAIQLLEIHELDQILFCPAHFSPHKRDEQPQVSKMHRYSMAAIAIERIEKFNILDWEIKREGPSYTIDTIRSLIEDRSKVGENIRWHLILGEDSLADFLDWKEVEELVLLAPPLIGCRIGQSTALDVDLPASLSEVIKRGLTKIPLMEISSTSIRERLRQKRYCGHLLPAKVLDYINQNQLY